MCDEEWHHYAINDNFPVVNLVVDGEEWTDQKDNPEIIGKPRIARTPHSADPV